MSSLPVSRPGRTLRPLCAALLALGLAQGAYAQVGLARGAPTPAAAGAARHLIGIRPASAPAAEGADAARVAMQQTLREALDLVGATPLRALHKQPVLVAELTPEQVAQLRLDPRVAYVEPDRLRYMAALDAGRSAPGAKAPAAPFEAAPAGYMDGFTTPSKAPLTVGQRVPYGLQRTQVLATPATPAAPPPDLTVCIIDSGYDRTHPDLAGNPVTGSRDRKAGWWFNDDMGHGSHVSGIVAGVDNGSGIVGTLPHGRIKLHMVKVFGHEMWTYSADLIDAVDECVAAGAKVINMSLTSEFSSEAERDAFQRVADGGVLMVAAAGNLGNASISYPAAYPSVVAVAATDSRDRRASYSQRNTTIEWAAPGSDVVSTVPMGLAGETSLVVDGQTQDAPRWVLRSKTSITVNGVLADFKDGKKVDRNMAGKICVASHKPDDFDLSQINANCERSKGVGVIVGNARQGTQYAYVYPQDGSPYLKLPVATVSLKQWKQLKTMFGKPATISVKPTNYVYYNGTSMATPYAAGVAALLWSQFPQCTAQQIRNVIGATAKDLGAPGRDNDFGFGLIQAKDAYTRLQGGSCGA